MKNTVRLNIFPPVAVNSIIDSLLCLPVRVVAKPPKNAAMKPLPPIASAATNDMIANTRNPIH
ncbi:MAG: hypothetical protein NTV68_00770 [Methanomicrobiales archaeon]|nr:hypothetical protein [Methanomicrobiales archaeon]